MTGWVGREYESHYLEYLRKSGRYYRVRVALQWGVTDRLEEDGLDSPRSLL